MPYCWKCGAELDKDARFCSTCGASIGPPTEPEKRRTERKERRPLGSLAVLTIVLIIIVAAAAIVAALAFLPVRTVDVNRQHSVPQKTGVNTLNLDFTADVAKVNIVFEDLSGERQSPSIILNASAAARVGVFQSSDLLENFFRSNDTTVGDVLTVTSQIDVPDWGWPSFSLFNVTCDIRIDASMNTSLNVKTSVGKIVMVTQAGVVFNSLSLEATTGGVEADLVEDVVVAGDVSVEATTGGVEFSWDNVIVTKDVLVDVETTTGGVEVVVKQDEELLGNVTVKALATTGGVNFTLDIQGDIGAKIESRTTLGGIDVDRKAGFSGFEALLESSNYPDSSNFDVILRTTVGGIDIYAERTP